MTAAPATAHPASRDYRVGGAEEQRAVERGLVSATWYRSPVPRARMLELVRRQDRRAVRDTVIWFVALGAAAVAAVVSWGSWWAVPAFLVYGTLYGSVSDSRWHECGHGTAFRTPWMNTALYHVASFMVFREPVSWRWSHARHHSDTIVVGRDPEIAVPRPTPRLRVLADVVGLVSNTAELRKMAVNVTGRLTAEEREYVPASERSAAVRWARIHLALLAATVAWSVVARSPLPLLLVGLPSFYGRWLLVVFGLTQHAGLDEDVLDHRRNTRTVRMNPVLRFLYWNMNFHVEHHMFPNVPFHALPDLHREIADDLPPVYPGLLAAYREIVPALWRQASDPTYRVERPLRSGAPMSEVPVAVRTDVVAPSAAPTGGTVWVDVGAVDEHPPGEVLRVDHGGDTYAVYRTADGRISASHGRCTHAGVHLAEGYVIGDTIECARHTGRFDVFTGAPCARPAREPLRIVGTRVVDGRIEIELPAG